MSGIPAGPPDSDLGKSRSNRRSSAEALRGAAGRSLLPRVFRSDPPKFGSAGAQASSPQPPLPEAPRSSIESAQPRAPEAPRESASRPGGGRFHAAHMLRGWLWPRRPATSSEHKEDPAEFDSLRKIRSRSRDPKVKSHPTADKAAEAAEGGSDSEDFIPMTEDDRLQHQRWCQRYQAELHDRLRAQIAAKEKEVTPGRPEVTRMRPLSSGSPQVTPGRPEVTRMRPLSSGSPQVLVDTAEIYNKHTHPGFEEWLASRDLEQMMSRELPTSTSTQIQQTVQESEVSSCFSSDEESLADEAADVLGDIPTWGEAPERGLPRRHPAAEPPPVRHWPSLEDEEGHAGPDAPACT